MTGRTPKRGCTGSLHNDYRNSQPWNLNPAKQASGNDWRQILRRGGRLGSTRFEHSIKLAARPILKNPGVHQNESAITEQ